MNIYKHIQPPSISRIAKHQQAPSLVLNLNTSNLCIYTNVYDGG